MARIWKGGIHPLGKKEITRKKPLLPLDLPPKRIVLPLRSPEGFLVTPVVKAGAVVKWGEKIAEPEDDQGVALFASVSGVVVDIDHEPHPLFGWTPSIVIENDRQMTPETYPTHPLDKLDQKEILDLVKARGIRGMARDNAPIHQKILATQGKVDTLIVNATECEPYLTADHRLLLERHEMVISGSLLLAKATGAKEIVLAIQGDKIDAIEALEHSEAWDKTRMRVHTIPTRYPFGHEKQVLRFVTGVEIPSGQDNLFARAVVFNVATAYAVAEGLLEGKPQTHRAITMAGGAIQRPRNFWLPIGTPMSCIIENAEGLRENPAVILSGGPMTGVSQRDLRAPILVNTPGILALSPWEVPGHLLEKNRPTMPCIGCGHCLSVCPMHLTPNQVYKEMDAPRRKGIAPLHPEDCISCGCCNYRCPAHLPLAQTMQAAQEFLKGEKPAEVEPDVKVYVPLKEDKKKKGKKHSDKNTDKNSEKSKKESKKEANQKRKNESGQDAPEKSKQEAEDAGHLTAKAKKKSKELAKKNAQEKREEMPVTPVTEAVPETPVPDVTEAVQEIPVPEVTEPVTETPVAEPAEEVAEPPDSALDEDMILSFLHQTPAPKMPTMDTVHIPDAIQLVEEPEIFVEILPEMEAEEESFPEEIGEAVSVTVPAEASPELPESAESPDLPFPPVQAIVPDSEVEIFVEILPDTEVADVFGGVSEDDPDQGKGASS